VWAGGTSIAKVEMKVAVLREEAHMRLTERAHNFMRFRRRWSLLKLVGLLVGGGVGCCCCCCCC